MHSLPSRRRVFARLRSAAAVIFFGVCAVMFSPRADAIESRSSVAAAQVPQQITDSTVRVKVETETRGSIISGYGSAFGVDLGAYGLSRPRYLLSAAHLVMNDDGRMLTGAIRVELPHGDRKVWAHCKVLAATKYYDLCLLECDEDVPVINKLTGAHPVLNIGTPIIVVGCPLGVPPRVSTGYLSNKDPLVSDRCRRVWEGSAAFNHGNSGGPVFGEQGSVIGVAVAGVRARGGGPQDMDPSVALFTPYYCVKHFLDVSLEKMVK